MLSNLLGWLVRSSNLAPEYQPQHCLVVTRARGGCSSCADSCPHHAITIAKQVSIDPIDCSGCGICVQACPSLALRANVSSQAGAPLTCSQVKGSAATVVCLARLRASDILRLVTKPHAAPAAASSATEQPRRITLVHGDCSQCPVADARVLDKLAEVIHDATTLAAYLGQRLQVVRLESDVPALRALLPSTTEDTESPTIALHLLQRAHFDTQDDPTLLSRREVLRGGWRNVQQHLADGLAPLEQLAQAIEAEESKEGSSLPLAHQQRWKVLELADLVPDALIDFPTPEVAEGCIMCPVCSNVCPSDAFSRTFEEGQEILWLEPSRCLASYGCDACVRSCPRQVIGLAPFTRWQALQQPHRAYQRASQQQIASVARD